MKKTVSIIVPIYKTDLDQLKACLNSLERQSYDRLEIILIDDNEAIDVSGKFIDSYVFSKAQVKILHQKNSGVSAARNKGLQNSTGDYIMFVDSDDILHEDAVSIMVDAIETSTSDLVMSSCNVSKGSKMHINHFYPQEFIDDMIKDLLLQTLSKGYSSYYPPLIGVGVPWAKLFKSDIIMSNNITFDITMSKYEDLNFLIKYLEHTSKITNIRKPLYTYRLHENTLSHGYNPNIFDVTKDSMQALQVTIEESVFSDLSDSLNIKKVNEINSIMKQDIVNRQNKKSFVRKIHDISKILQDSYFVKINQLNTDKMTLKERVIYFLVKHRLSVFLLLIFKIEDK